MPNPAFVRKIAVVVSIVALVGASAVPGRAAPPASCAGADGPPTRVVTGSFSEEQEGSYVLVPFDVVENSTRVRVKLCYDRPDTPLSAQIKHTLDLGLYETLGGDGFYDTEEFRGWGGSSRLNVLVTPEQATLGFNPGPIPPGPWAAEIGVAAVADQDEGDSDGRVNWRLEVFVGSDPSDLDVPWQPAPYDESPARGEAGWYKGDFHVHAEHSNPDGATMRHTFDYAFGPRPEGAGLDFITLSDYVGNRHWGEIGRFQADYPGKLIMRSAEIITYRGHVNNHDSATFVDYRTGPIYGRAEDGTLVKLRDAQPASRLFDDIHAAGGFTQINHPTTFPSEVPGFGNFCRGCSWDYSDQETDWAKVDAMEIQTGPSGLFEPKGNEPGPNPFTPLAIDMYDGLRREGFDITAVGSSDSHDADHEELTQSPIGEATTVVFAPELSEDGIHQGILAGHAYVKFFSSDGPDLRFEATPSAGGESVIMGDDLNAQTGEFTARVIGGAPSPQVRTLLVLRDGRPINAVVVPNDDFTFTFTGTTPGDYRLQLQRGSAIEALTNPITLTGVDPPPDPESTSLVFTDDSATEGRRMQTVPIKARLTDESGAAIAAADVTFALSGKKGSKQWTEQTDGNGVAGRDVLLDLHPGRYTLSARFAGRQDSYEPSETQREFRVFGTGG